MTNSIAKSGDNTGVPRNNWEQMRGAVWDYYGRILDPIAFGEFLGKAGVDRVLVNAEEKSVPWVRDYQTGVGAFMAKFY